MSKANKRQWQPREMRMVAEYLAKHYGDYPFMTRVRLGSHHPKLHPEDMEESEQRMVGVFRRWADAIVFMPDRLVLIEAKIRPTPGVISQIELYERLLPHTPELTEYKGRPIEKVLLYAIEDPVITAMAREKGIKAVYYRPEWVEEYLTELYPRERRAPLTHPNTGQ
jgi:hypothetical protein